MPQYIINAPCMGKLIFRVFKGKYSIIEALTYKKTIE
jgi:hypothetical protein